MLPTITQEATGNMARNLRALVTKNSMKERYKTAQTYLKKIKFLIDDVSSASFFSFSSPIRIFSLIRFCSLSMHCPMSSFG